ncbi:MAG: helix-turn-helix domain-containing protein [Rhodococcus sp. (in: high G+C Gram-positive bacteria)]|uniref:helix-turn-helix domain-containing protein n=1 Tax=Rhodococcus sp. TaxID=1831 RepID=UPI003BAF6453
MADIGVFAKSARITGQSRAELQAQLKARYEAGASIRSLAREMGRSYGFVRNILAESEVPLRGRGGAHRGRSRAPSVAPPNRFLDEVEDS